MQVKPPSWDGWNFLVAYDADYYREGNHGKNVFNG